MLLAAGQRMGRNNHADSCQRRARFWIIPQRSYANCSKPVGSEPGIHLLSCQEQDGDVAMNDSYVGPGVRYTPYAIPTYYPRDSCHNGDQNHDHMEKERKSPDEEMEDNNRDRTSRKLFKITISIYSMSSDIPNSKQKWLKSRNAKLIKVIKKKQDDVHQEALDLVRQHCAPDMTSHDTEIQSNLGNGTAASLEIQEENMPKLLPFNSSKNKPYRLDSLSDRVRKTPDIKSPHLLQNKAEGEMAGVKGLEPEEMCADTKPLCTTFPDEPTNVSELLDLFPKLLSLDDQELPSPVFSDTGDNKKLPVCKGSIYGSDTMKNLVWKFLKQYYSIYDDGDRQSLLSAYHDNACFSLSTPFKPEEPSLINLPKYSKDNRNTEELNRFGLSVQLLKHTKTEIVDFFSVLPKTLHDLSSFVVDTCVETENMLCFSVNGLFKEEVEGMCQAHVCAFTRIFIALPGTNSSLRIVNDQWSVKSISSKESQSAYSTLVPTPAFSSMHTVSQEQQKMAQVFSVPSGMSLQ
ncbi:nuclear RNA export factor 3-like [Echinops telfairi]|uniref:Nuclear RNA export factor 3-like n=1 Tax=Echinops telfairi TaxID=9371 RepID=A0AC55D4Q2_ECHTE|nr:nuclear RNA export factor 3-like [Echinops telfairi]